MREITREENTTREEKIMIALLIGLTAALGCMALGVGVFVLGQPATPPPLLAESDVRGGVRGILP